MERGGYIYIITNQNHTVLYTGVTSNLIVRIHQHITKFYPKAFTAKYNCNKLVYYEGISTIEEAIEREHQIKAGNRQRKIELIESINVDWKDLYPKVVELGLD